MWIVPAGVLRKVWGVDSTCGCLEEGVGCGQYLRVLEEGVGCGQYLRVLEEGVGCGQYLPVLEEGVECGQYLRVSWGRCGVWTVPVGVSRKVLGVDSTCGFLRKVWGVDSTCGFLRKVGWLEQPPALSGLAQAPWSDPSCHVLRREKMDVLTSVHVSSRLKY